MADSGIDSAEELSGQNALGLVGGGNRVRKSRRQV
jgi:hypothetical protein